MLQNISVETVCQFEASESIIQESYDDDDLPPLDVDDGDET